MNKVQFYGKTSDVMIKIPKTVQKTALFAFKLKDLGFKGGKETGWKRAKQLSTKEYIPIEDLQFMYRWFSRHLYTSFPSYLKWKNNGKPETKEWYNVRGIISWLIWGGDTAFKWINSKKNINLLNKHFDKNYTQKSLDA